MPDPNATIDPELQAELEQADADLEAGNTQTLDETVAAIAVEAQSATDVPEPDNDPIVPAAVETVEPAGFTNELAVGPEGEPAADPGTAVPDAGDEPLPPWGDGPKPGTEGHTITPDASYAQDSLQPGILGAAGQGAGPEVHTKPGDLPVGHGAEPLDPETPMANPGYVMPSPGQQGPPPAPTDFVPAPPESELTQADLEAGFVASVDSQIQWGPFKDYEVIATQYGEFGVPRSTIMRLTTQVVWDPKEQRHVNAVLPVYEEVRIKDPRTDPKL